MVIIYHESDTKEDKPNGSWAYWGVFKNDEKIRHVWKKRVTEKEADDYYLKIDHD